MWEIALLIPLRTDATELPATNITGNLRTFEPTTNRENVNYRYSERQKSYETL